MRAFLFIICFLFTAHLASGQPSSIQEQLKALEQFLESHIPANHFDVKGYELTLEGHNLTKRTLVDDGSSHSISFMLKNARFTLEHFELDDESAAAYGYEAYWEVYISDQWFLTEIINKKDALKLIELLEQLLASLEE